VSPRQQFDMLTGDRGAYTADIGLALCMYLAWEAVASLTTNTAPPFTPVNPQGQKERVQALRAQPPGQVLDIRLMGNWWGGERPRAGRLGWVVATRAMHQVDLLGTGIVGFQVFVADRPGRRGAALVLQRAEIFAAQARQRGAIDLGVAADIVMHAGVEWLA